MIPSGLPKRGDKEEKFTFIHSEKPISVDGLFCFSISVMEDGLHPTPDSSLTHQAGVRAASGFLSLRHYFSVI